MQNETAGEVHSHVIAVEGDPCPVIVELPSKIYTDRDAAWVVLMSILLKIPIESDHLSGLVVKASASRVKDSGFESRLCWDYSESIQTSDLKIGTPVATLPGAWHSRVSAGTGQPGGWVR